MYFCIPLAWTACIILSTILLFNILSCCRYLNGHFAWVKFARCKLTDLCNRKVSSCIPLNTISYKTPKCSGSIALSSYFTLHPSPNVVIRRTGKEYTHITVMLLLHILHEFYLNKVTCISTICFRTPATLNLSKTTTASNEK